MYAVSTPNLFHKLRKRSGEGVRGNSMKQKVHRTLNKKKLSIPTHRCKQGLNISSCLLWPVA